MKIVRDYRTWIKSNPSNFSFAQGKNRKSFFYFISSKSKVRSDDDLKKFEIWISEKNYFSPAQYLETCDEDFQHFWDFNTIYLTFFLVFSNFHLLLPLMLSRELGNPFFSYPLELFQEFLIVEIHSEFYLRTLFQR